MHHAPRGWQPQGGTTWLNACSHAGLGGAGCRGQSGSWRPQDGDLEVDSGVAFSSFLGKK
jgi:hypothetical protein